MKKFYSFVLICGLFASNTYASTAYYDQKILSQQDAENEALTGIASGYTGGAAYFVMLALAANATKLASEGKLNIESAIVHGLGFSLSAGVTSGLLQRLKEAAFKLRWNGWKSLSEFTSVTGGSAYLFCCVAGLVHTGKTITSIPAVAQLLS